MELETAVRAPKFVGYDAFREIQLEDDFPPRTIRMLQEMGHQIKRYDHPDLYFGGPNTIAVGPDGTLTGVGSIRRLGGAAAPETGGPAQ